MERKREGHTNEIGRVTTEAVKGSKTIPDGICHPNFIIFVSLLTPRQLYAAAEKGHADTVQALLEAGADVNKAKEITPLLVAT